MLEHFQLSDLKKMNLAEMKILAEEIRQTMIETVSKNGGHLASNLGVVELTIAIHKVFDSPKDKIIFDVSHQTYTHKILTGRYSQFKDLRRVGGISGFASCKESIHDAYETGHSSTAIAAGLGFLEAKKVNPTSIGEVLAVVGDASIVNGLSFEALNYLGSHPKEKMIILLNDNGMSISKNVGALAKSYNKIRLGKTSRIIKAITPKFIRKLAKSSLYHVQLFTSLGLRYFEGIDGNNLEEVIRYLNFAKQSEESVVLHIRTRKGKGFQVCEEDGKGLWHSAVPFDLNHPSQPEETSSTGVALSKKLLDLRKEISGIRVITPAMMLGCGISSFAKEAPDDFIDVGISEELSVTMASSMAQAGLSPVIFGYTTFMQRAYDEILHDVTRTNQPVIFCMDHFGIVPYDGTTHQGIYGLSYLASIPGLTILLPTSTSDATRMLEDSLRKRRGPVAICYRGQEEDTPSLWKENQWSILKEGKAYLLSYGVALTRAKSFRLPDECGLVYASSYYLDEDFLNQVAKTHSPLFVYEELIEHASLGEEIRCYLSKKNIYIPVITFSLPNTYVGPYSRKETWEAFGLSQEEIESTIKNTLKNIEK